MFLIRLSLILTMLCGMSLQAGLFERVDRNPGSKNTIKVLLVHDKPGVMVEVKGKYRIFDPNTNKYLTTRFLGKRKLIQAIRDGIKWGEEFPGIHQLLIVPGNEETTTLVDGIEYRGLVYVYDIGGAISVVNEIDYDDYLNSLITNKLKRELPKEALAAYVIAERTLALYRTMHAPSPYWAVRGDWVGYQGIAIINPKSFLAEVIAETRNMVMSEEDSFQGIKPFPSVWKKESESPDGVVAKIDLNQADSLARSGRNASQILKKAFPNCSMKLMQD